uniref:ZP domain-containing protein n=1 Tax=Steinernema glaseri TaxID=37863 RepID=A0A1I7ZI24_9BILA
MATHRLVVLLLLSFTSVAATSNIDVSDVCELRIHDSAPVGSKMTMNEALERRVRNSKNCFGQLEPDIDWIEFDTTRSVFVTRAMVPSSGSEPKKAVLHMMCPSYQ